MLQGIGEGLCRGEANLRWQLMRARNPDMKQETLDYECDATDAFMDELNRSYLGRLRIEWLKKGREEGLA